MMLCIDVGNSHIYGGVFHEDEIRLRFRKTSQASTSDEFGIFLKSVLKENGILPESIRHISICSVVPQLDYSLRAACLKYFSIEPFILQPGVRTGLNIICRNPQELGADRIANAIAAVKKYPNQNIIVIDFGTATTLCAIGKKRDYRGGAILPGLRLAVDALTRHTAKLPSVEIIKLDEMVGRSTVENIQSGVYFGMLGACKELVSRIQQTFFSGESLITIATGGFSTLFDTQGLYDKILPDLVLEGIREAYCLNHS